MSDEVFNDDGSLRCNLCRNEPCVCGKSRDPSREAFEAWWHSPPPAWWDSPQTLAWQSWQAALAWKAEQEKAPRIRNALRRIVRKDGAIDVTDATINHARRILGDKANGNG